MTTPASRVHILAYNFRLAVALILSIAGLLHAGCAAAGADQRRQPAPQKASRESQRATLSLDDVKPVPPAPSPAESPAEALSSAGQRRLDRSRELFRELRFTEAGIELDKALRREPNHPQLLRELARVQFATDRMERVRSTLQKTLDAGGDDILVHYLNGRLSIASDLPAEAVRSFRIALKSTNAEREQELTALTYFYLARSLNAEGYLTAAVEAYRGYENKASGMKPESVLEPDLATLLRINGGNAGQPISVALEKLGRHSEAADVLFAAASVIPPDTATRERLARMLVKAGRIDEALSQARTALKEGGKSADLLLAIHTAAGRPEAAVDDLKSLLAESPNRADLRGLLADTLVSLDRSSEAIGVLNTAIESDSNNSALIKRVYQLQLDRRDWSDAVRSLARLIAADESNDQYAKQQTVALSAKPGAVEAILNDDVQASGSSETFAYDYLRGILALENENRSAAEKSLRNALDRRDSFVAARVALARLKLDQYQWGAAIEIASAKEELFKQSTSLLFVAGAAHAGLDQFDEAEEALLLALERDETNLEAIQSLAELYREKREFRLAERRYKALLDINPLDHDTRESLFDLYLDVLDRRPEAARQRTEFRRLDAPEPYIARCSARLELGLRPDAEKREKYRKSLVEILAKHGDDALTLELLARDQISRDQFEEAMDTVKRGLKVAPQDASLHEIKEATHLALLEYDDAIETIQWLIDRYPNRTRWIDRMLGLQLVDHRFEDALEMARKLQKKENLSEEDQQRYRSLVAYSLTRLERYDEQIAILKEWRAENPDDAVRTESLIDAYISAEQFDDAVVIARDYQERAGDDRSRGRLIDALRAAERFGAAERFMLEQLDNDPDNEQLIRILSYVLTLSDKHDDALELLENLERRYPFADYRTVKIQTLAGADRFDEAIRLCKKMLAEAASQSNDVENFNVLQAREMLAQLLIQDAQYDEAATLLRDWVDETRSPRIKYAFLSQLSVCYQIQDELDRAIDVLAEAYALKEELPPGFTTGINNDYGYSLADAGRRIPEAEAMIRAALGRDPNNAAYLDSMGWVLYKKGEWSQAADWLMKAVNSPDGEDPVVFDHAGDVFWRLGNKDEAVRHWEQAVEIATEQIAELNRRDLQRVLDNVRKNKLGAIENGDDPVVAPTAKEQAAEKAKE